MTFRLIVTGSKLYSNDRHINHVLDSLFEKHGKLMIFEDGGAVGRVARMWAKENDCHTITTNMDDEIEDTLETTRLRNKIMIGYFPSLVLLFGSGLDTLDLEQQAIVNDIEIRIEE